MIEGEIHYSESDLSRDKERADAALKEVERLAKEIENLPEEERAKRIADTKQVLDNNGIFSDSLDLKTTVSKFVGLEYKEMK